MKTTPRLCTVDRFDAREYRGLRSEVIELVAHEIVQPVGRQAGTGKALYSEAELIITAGERVLARATAFINSLPAEMRALTERHPRADCSTRHIVARGTPMRVPTAYNRMALHFPS